MNVNLVQGLVRLREPAVILRCREIDRKLVESVVDEAKKEYSEKAKVQPPRITIDERVYLPSALDSHLLFTCLQSAGCFIVCPR